MLDRVEASIIPSPIKKAQPPINIMTMIKQYNNDPFHISEPICWGPHEMLAAWGGVSFVGGVGGGKGLRCSKRL